MCLVGRGCSVVNPGVKDAGHTCIDSSVGCLCYC